MVSQRGKGMERIVKNNKLVILTTLIFTLTMGFFTLKIKINPDVTDYLPESDTVVKNFNKIGRDYGGSLTGFLVYESDKIFDERSLLEVKRLSEEMEKVEGINLVSSISNLVDIKSKDDDIRIEKVISFDSLKDEKYLSEKEKFFKSDNFYKGKFLSEDGKKSLIILFFDDDCDQQKVCAEIKNIVKKSELKGKIYYGGLPFLFEEIGTLIVKDLTKLLVPCILIMVIILSISFKSVEGVLIPLFNSLISIISVAGIMSILKVKVTIISNIIPIILLAVGSAYSIHFISKVYELESEGKNRKEAIEESLKVIFLPISLAALTTFIGFISFVGGSYLVMIREFGIFTAVGVLVSFFLSVTFTPSLMIITKKSRSVVNSEKENDRFVEIVDKIIKYKKMLVTLSVTLSIVSLIFLPKMSRSADIIEYFKKGSEFRKSNDIIEKDFNGSSRFLIIAGGNMNSVKNLKKVEEVETFIKDSLGLNNTNSIIQVIKRTNKIIEGKEQLPENDEKLSNLYFLIEGEKSLDRLIKPDKSETVLEVSFQDGLSLERVRKLQEKIEEKVKMVNGDLNFSITGMPSVYIRLDKSILKSTIVSTFLSLGLIFILLSFIFRSLIKGVKGILPIFFTIIMVYGIMSLTRISLDIATNLIGSIAIGIGIDYSIHYLLRLNSELKNNKDFNVATKNTLLTTGRAILTNVFTVSAGFAVLIFSDLKPLSNFGFLIMLTMLLAGFSTIVIFSVSITKKERK